ncbi:MAG: type II toxin-antitoxin system RelE/ParE family toxin [Candidatus Diapherotrites archaeon]|nr:type II toxin-antitoxin system RelE/ParE family toxin [Candidatus Diapherotrites archaeon]
MFELLVTERFAKELKKLQSSERERIKEKSRVSQENPLLFFERLTGNELFKLRVGSFRVIALIHFGKKTITALSVGLRKNVYDKL